jgi:hypothetical protein
MLEIVPYISVGRIRLGASTSELEAVLGEPDEVRHDGLGAHRELRSVRRRVPELQ